MKRKSNTVQALRIIFSLMLVLLGLSGCDDSEDGRGLPVGGMPNTAPGHGYVLNSTDYTLIVYVNGQDEYQVRIQPGDVMAMGLEAEQTHLLHVIALDASGQAFAEYVNNFYINNIALDNHVRDVICSWYVDVTSTSGYANQFGS